MLCGVTFWLLYGFSRQVTAHTQRPRLISAATDTWRTYAAENLFLKSHGRKGDTTYSTLLQRVNYTRPKKYNGEPARFQAAQEPHHMHARICLPPTTTHRATKRNGQFRVHSVLCNVASIYGA